jgi:hypothetical protein
MEQSKRDFITDYEFRRKVALRAYEIYENRGGQHGRDLDDWLQAEAELLSRPEPGQSVSREPVQASGAKSVSQSAEAPKRAPAGRRPPRTR